MTRIERITSVKESEARKMFDWETDSANKLYCGPCKGPNEPPRHNNWQELQAELNQSTAYRFGIYDDTEFVGEFNFKFDHGALLRKDPKTAWISIGIGDSCYRGKGFGAIAMETIEREVKALGGMRIELGVFGFNEPAIQFYEKLGYRRFAEIPGFTWWEGKWWSDFRYEKFL